MYNTNMNQDLADKLYILQKNVLELHNLFDLNMVANQSHTIEDLLSKVTLLIKSTLGLKSIRFFVMNNGIFQTKSIASDSDLDFEFIADNAPFLQTEKEELIKVTNQDGSPIYKSFWNTHKLQELQCEYIKVFYNDENPFCVCSISKKEDNSNFNDDELKSYLRELSNQGPSIVIVTSVPVIDNPHLTSVYAYNSVGNRYWKVTCPFLPAHYPGTGDSFTSVITGSLLQGDSLPLALDRAM